MSENEKHKKNPLIIVVIILLLVIIAGGGYAGYNIINRNKKTAPKTEMTYSLDEFVINTADIGERRYVKVKIYVGYTESKLSAELETKKPILRDSINSILYSKKAQDMNETGLAGMKTEIIDKLNMLLQKGKIENIYYYEFLLQ